MIKQATVPPKAEREGGQRKGRARKPAASNNAFGNKSATIMKRQPHPFHFLILAILTILAVGCANPQHEQAESDSNALSVSKDTFSRAATHPRYARLFSVEYRQGAKVIRVKNPFDTTHIQQTYVLIPRGTEPDTSLPEGKVIPIPLSKAALAHTTHIGFFNKLGLLDAIGGVSQKKYIKNQQVREAVEKGQITEFGPSHNINVEKLLHVNPALLFVAPFKDNRYEKIRDVGIPIAVNASYMETTPLGRAEWIKFISYFFNKEQKADSIFTRVANHYHRLSGMVPEDEKAPAIFSGKKIGQVWYVPGGESYMAEFFKDAGARYLWNENAESGSLPLDFETVFMRAKDADYWCILENFQGEYSYNQLASENMHYDEFDAFRNKQVIVCNTHVSPYYEQGILEPDIILADLISILYPQRLPGHKNKYYHLLTQP